MPATPVPQTLQQTARDPLTLPCGRDTKIIDIEVGLGVDVEMDMAGDLTDDQAIRDGDHEQMPRCVEVALQPGRIDRRVENVGGDVLKER